MTPFFRSTAVVCLYLWIDSQLAAPQIPVAAGEDLQAALNNANPGDTLILQAGAVYTGNFILPNKTVLPIGPKGGVTEIPQLTPYITITSSQLSALPPAGTRVTPSDAVNMAAIVTPNGAAALATAPDAHHYKLVGLEIHPAENIYGGDLLDLGDSVSPTIGAQAHDFEVDRVYIHGDPSQGAKRGIGLNSASTNVTNSYISDIKSTFQDSQAICGWNGPGPYTIVNNELEASGENVMFGGAAPSIPNLTPSDCD